MDEETSSMTLSGALTDGGRRSPRPRTDVVVGLLWGLSACTALSSPESVAIRGTIPPAVEEVEVIYREGHPPAVLLRATHEIAPTQAFRPQDQTVDLLALAEEIRPFGDCRAQVERTGQRRLMRATGSPGGPCEYLLSVRPHGKPLDALSYETLRVQGEASGPTTLALADEAAQRREDNVPLVTVNGRFDVRIPLRAAAKRADLRRLVSLAMLSASNQGTLLIETLSLERTQRTGRATPRIGFWVWNYRQAVANRLATLDACRRHGCTRILVQIPMIEDTPETWDAYVTLLREAASVGIEPYALDGYPEAIYASHPLTEKVRRVLALMPSGSLAGVQLDIEPYVIPGFFIDDSGFVRYLLTIDRVKDALDGQARLSVVMPFWFTAETVGNRPVAFSVTDRADEVAIMSYRTDVDEARAIADDTLRYGDLAGVPVWMAIETRALPLERHVLLTRESRRDFANAYLDRLGGQVVLAPPSSRTPSSAERDWFRISHRFTVRPERLTFAGRPRTEVRATIRAIDDTVRNPSLTGVLIHDLDGFLSLPE